MSNFYLYKDNILSKIKENDELDKILEYIENHRGENIKIKVDGVFTSTMQVQKETMVHIIKRVKDYNDDMIETYMQLSNSNKEN
jgi:hypothetical protein